MFAGAVHFWAAPISSSELRPQRKIHTDSDFFEETKVGKVFSACMTWYMLGYILVLFVKILKIDIETGYKTTSRSTYRNNSNNIKIVSGD